MPEPVTLRAEWEDLLSRRPSLLPTLAFFEPIVAAWERFDSSRISPLTWSSEECRARWMHGADILAEAPLPFDRQSLDPLLDPVLSAVAGLGEESAVAIERLAEAWDDGRLGVRSLLTGVEGLAVSTDVLSFVAYLVLRPPLETYLSTAGQAFKDEYWDSGHCPLCGAAPAWADIRDDGKRRLCCARCGGTWTIGRLRCPFCENRDAKTLTRLAAEGAEEGYLIEACDVCRGYLKGVDRRVRWNAASPLVEDWGTPHLDLIARRREYWRATPSLVHVAQLRER